MYYKDGDNYLIVVYLIYLFSRETVQRCMVFSAFLCSFGGVDDLKENPSKIVGISI